MVWISNKIKYRNGCALKASLPGMPRNLELKILNCGTAAIEGRPVHTGHVCSVGVSNGEKGKKN